MLHLLQPTGMMIRQVLHSLRRLHTRRVAGLESSEPVLAQKGELTD